jgi:hypothetical protein
MEARKTSEALHATMELRERLYRLSALDPRVATLHVEALEMLAYDLHAAFREEACKGFISWGPGASEDDDADECRAAYMGDIDDGVRVTIHMEPHVADVTRPFTLGDGSRGRRAYPGASPTGRHIE